MSDDERIRDLARRAAARDLSAARDLVAELEADGGGAATAPTPSAATPAGPQPARLSPDRREVLGDALEMLTEYPPVHVRGGNEPHSGQRDCDICGYPLSGTTAPGLPSHDDYVGSPVHGSTPCRYRKVLRDLREVVEAEKTRPMHPPGIVVLSYRRDHHDRHGDGNRSAFDIHVTDDEEEAARYIAGQILEDVDAEFIHLVFDRWDQLVHFARYSGSRSPAPGEESVDVPTRWSVTDEDFQDQEAVDAEELRHEEMRARIRDLVAKQLGEASEAAKKAAAAEAQRKQAEEARLARERRLAEYERLKAEFEPKPAQGER